MVHVQAILFMSLSASLLSAFLAMLGKQWLNRYASTDMRGSAVERCRNRQRKLDGIDAWHFDSVMESLPLMLQAALLLLGCALSRYLWEVDKTIAFVVVGVTSFGVLFYLFIAIAGAISEVCPYQTPGSHFTRYLMQQVLSKLASAKRRSMVTWVFKKFWYDALGFMHVIKTFAAQVVLIPIALSLDGYHLGRVAIRTISIGTYHLIRRACHWARGMYSSGEQKLDQQAAVLDVRCVSWTLQTSLEKPVHYSIVKYLATIPELLDLDPTLIMGCFEVFVGCVSVGGGKAVIIEGLDQLATASARCLFRTFHRLSVTDPTSSVLADLHQRYKTIFHPRLDLTDLPFYPTMMTIHLLVNRGLSHYGKIWWHKFSPSSQDHIAFAQHMVKAAQIEYQRTEHRKVSRWILRFALHSLYLDPPPSACIVADCLTIIAIDLDCDVSKITISNERWVQI